VIGPDLKDLEPGGNYAYGIWIDVAGKEVEEELEGVIERRVHEFCNYIEGFMHLNQRMCICTAPPMPGVSGIPPG